MWEGGLGKCVGGEGEGLGVGGGSRHYCRDASATVVTLGVWQEGSGCSDHDCTVIPRPQTPRGQGLTCVCVRL